MVIKIRYGKNETGWAKKSEDGYMISNVPLTEGLNIDDLVEIRENEDEDDFPFINKVIKINYVSKTVFEYQEIVDYKQIKNEIEISNNGKIEGLFSPSVNNGRFHRGLAIIASNFKKSEINKILKRYGAKIINYQSRN